MSQLTLIACGDIMLGRQVADVIAQKGVDFPFSQIKTTLHGHDIVFGVLDSPVSIEARPNPNKPKDFPKIKCTPQAITGLKNAGFDVIHIGTNHVMDFGEEGLKETIKACETNGLKHIGAGTTMPEARTPVIIEKNGIKAGFLGYCLSYPAQKDKAGCAPMKLEIIKEDIRALKAQVNFVIVSIHHGIEYSFYPYPEYRDMVHSIIDCGAQVVLGHHPHAIQGYEYYHQGFIIYSLGNFVFDNDDKSADDGGVSSLRRELENGGYISRPGTPRFHESIMVQILFSDTAIERVSFLPAVINESYQPAPADEKRTEEIFAYFREISGALKNGDAPFLKKLSRLYALESVSGMLKYNMGNIVSRFYKIRWRHVRQFLLYASSGKN